MQIYIILEHPNKSKKSCKDYKNLLEAPPEDADFVETSSLLLITYFPCPKKMFFRIKKQKKSP